MKESCGGTTVSVEAPLNTVIGRRLRTLREERRIPRERLALALEMSSENLRNYEAGKQKLTLAMLPTVADTYGMSLPDLLVELFNFEGSPCQSESTFVNERHNKGTANYNYTESAKPSFGPSRTRSVPSPELVAAGR
jgi:transcriptional regulator with XRE-family HTH domain